jgi:branched-chain amino acid transport system substrate-binding protein
MTGNTHGWSVVRSRVPGWMNIAILTIICALYTLAAGQARAAGESIRVGVLVPLTGTFSDSGRQITNGIKTYMKLHGDTVAGKKVELIIKDTTGAAPEVAKRLAQELVVKDKVDFLAGFSLSPNALAVAPVATEAKKPMIIMNAATSVVTTKSPYIARLSYTLAQVTEPLAQWAYKSGLRKVYTVVTDYAPGHDSERAFQKAFTKLGGEVVGELRVPLKNPDFGPFVQRVKDSKPEAVYLFTPAGEAAVAFIKSFNERGLAKAGIKLLSTGDVIDAGVIEAIGESMLGVITTAHYPITHQSPENKAFLAAYREIDPKTLPNGHAMGGYDGMAAIYTVAKQLNGKIDGDKAMQALKGMKLTSPRGPILIDPETRDIVQDVYVCEVKKVNGKLNSFEFETFRAVKDPGK